MIRARFFSLDAGEDLLLALRPLGFPRAPASFLAGTLVQGAALALCPHGNPGMAAGGMGDVLCGLIAGLMAQGLGPEQAARAGVLVHALAGDRAAAARGERGLVPSDLLDELSPLLNPA